jgi:16S rRNA (guanine966-N2)-methyltransferase
VRITGGKLRSRTLDAPKGVATRPTSDRVREALFAILGSKAPGLTEARVLDLYAGTGSLAIEALSRGAAFAVLVEPARAAIQAIEANRKALGLVRQVKVVHSTVERAASVVRAAGPFDLVFADPPYVQVSTGEAARAIGALLEASKGDSSLLTATGQLVLEHAKGDEAPSFPRVQLIETRRYGDTRLSFYENL